MNVSDAWCINYGLSSNAPVVSGADGGAAPWHGLLAVFRLSPAFRSMPTHSLESLATLLRADQSVMRAYKTYVNISRAWFLTSLTVICVRHQEHARCDL